MGDSIYIIMDADKDYNLFATLDIAAGIGYWLDFQNIVSLKYRNYQMRQVFDDYLDMSSLTIKKSCPKIGLHLKHYWVDQKLSLFNEIGVLGIFLSDQNESLKLKSRYTIEEVSYLRKKNYRSTGNIDFMLNFSLGIKYEINQRFFLEGFIESVLGLKNLSTDLVLLKNSYEHNGAIIENITNNITATNSGNKIALGLSLVYNF